MKYDLTVNLDTFITIAYCLITAFILIIAYRQLKSFNRTDNALFLHNLYTKFFTKPTIKLITIIHADCIEFDVNENNPIFKVLIPKLNGIYPHRKRELKGYYTTYEIDHFLLNPLDSVGSHVQNNVIELSSAHQDFRMFVTVVLNNSPF